MLGLGFEFDPVYLVKLAVFNDFVSRFLRNDAQLALHFGQGTFDVEVFCGAVFVRPNLAHGGIAEHVAENFGVNDGCGHESPVLSRVAVDSLLLWLWF